MAKADEFTSILMALQGVTVLEAPRVSRETIISTLRDHTLVLRDIKKGLGSVTSIVTSLAAEAGDNRRILQNLQDDNKKMRVDIEKLYSLSDEFRTEMNEMGEKVADLFSLKQTVREHREFVDDLNVRFGNHKRDCTEYFETNDKNTEAAEKKANETIFSLKELKDYVEHFADNLILPSSQITVESAAGYASRPTPLLEILKTQNATNKEHASTLKTQGDDITENQNKIATKADDSLVHDVKGLSRKVTAIENHILKEEEQGVGAIRRSCEELADKMQGMTTEMTEKMDRREVSFIVHEKYEEIVKYLQDALQSSSEDENNFKQKADEIQALVMTLSNTKADRLEIAPMQEILVKTEVMLKKMGGKNSKDTLSKKEIIALLELKVDREEFEQKLQNKLRGDKRNKRLAALGQTPSVVDEAGSSEFNDANNNLQVSDIARDKAMWKNIAENMRDESEEAILRAAYKAHTAGGGNTNDFSAFVLSKKAQKAGKAVSVMNLPNNTIPGNLRSSTEAGRAGGIDLGSRPTTSERPHSQGGYVAGVGQPGGRSDLYKDTSYPHVPPEGGSNESKLDQRQNQEHVQDMSFIGGQVAGGGFNQRSGTSLRQGPIKSLMESQPTSKLEEVTGLGVMVKGEDKKFYITDDANGDNIDPATAYSKPINARK